MRLLNSVLFYAREDKWFVEYGNISEPTKLHLRLSMLWLYFFTATGTAQDDWPIKTAMAGQLR